MATLIQCLRQGGFIEYRINSATTGLFSRGMTGLANALCPVHWAPSDWTRKSSTWRIDPGWCNLIASSARSVGSSPTPSNKRHRPVE